MNFFQEIEQFSKKHHPLSILSKELSECHFHALGLPEDTIPSFHSNSIEHEYKLQKKHLIFKAFYSRYRSNEIQHKGPIVLFTWVIAGGLGDLSMQIVSKKLLQSALPSSNIITIALVEKSAFIPKQLQKEITYLHRYNQSDYTPLPKDIINIMHSGSLLLQMPTHYPHFNKIIQGSKSNYQLIGEYGFITTKEFSPTTNAICMGLHSLEKGILIKKKPKQQNLMHLIPTNNYYFCYLITKRGFTIYLSMILHKEMGKPDDIHFVNFSLHKFLPVLEKFPFKEFHIKNVLIHDAHKTATLKVNATGKSIHIHHLTNIAGENLHNLMIQSNEPVGIRGDQTFSEAISFEKLFFYDALKHARPFMKDLHSLALNHTTQNSALEIFIKLQQSSYQEQEEWMLIGKLLADQCNNNQLKKEYLLFAQLIRSRHNFNKSFVDLVKAKLLYHQNPILRKQDQSIISSYVNNQITFVDLIKSGDKNNG